MDTIFHPVSGEKGYFCTEQEKTLIDAIIIDWNSKNLVVQDSSHDVRGVVNE